MVPNVIFYFPEVLIDLFKALDESWINIKLQGFESGFKSIQLLFDIFQGSALKMLCLDLKDGDLVNQLAQ